MSINIYPAQVQGNVISHAGKWSDNSTMNLANANFASLAKELKLEDIMVAPGHIRIKTLKMALQMIHSPRYSERLKTLLHQAEELKASHIAFS